MAKINFHIISIFPESFASYFGASIIKRAENKKIIKINTVNLRDFAADKHRKVDDSPYGGGPGMVIKIEPVCEAVNSVKQKIRGVKSNTRTILFSTRGRPFSEKEAERFTKYKNLILICGRYEGVDERVAKHVADEEISIGSYILSGGELPAMVLVDAVSRKIPGVLGKLESLEELKGSYPVYTKPEIFKIGRKKAKVPEVLLSGNHKKIKEWRQNL